MAYTDDPDRNDEKANVTGAKTVQTRDGQEYEVKGNPVLYPKGTKVRVIKGKNQGSNKQVTVRYPNGEFWKAIAIPIILLLVGIMMFSSCSPSFDPSYRSAAENGAYEILEEGYRNLTLEAENEVIDFIIDEEITLKRGLFVKCEINNRFHLFYLSYRTVMADLDPNELENLFSKVRVGRAIVKQTVSCDLCKKQ